MVHGTCVSVECNRRDFFKLFEHELAGFPIVNATAEIFIKVEKVDDLPQKPPEKPYYTDSFLLSKYSLKRDGTSITFHGDSALVETTQNDKGWTILCQYNSSFNDKWFLELVADVIYDLAYIVLVSKNYFPLHSGALVTPKGKTVLLCGNSFKGKTTLCLAGLTAGWSILSDDMPLLKINSDKNIVEVFSFPRSLRVCKDTLDEFQVLKGKCYSVEEFYFVSDEMTMLKRISDSLPQEVLKKMKRGQKARISLEQAFPGSLVTESVPTDIIILSRGNAYVHKEYKPHQVMNNIIAENVMIYRFRNPSFNIYQRFCSVIQRLVKQCKLHELILGANLHENGEKLIQLFS